MVKNGIPFDVATNLDTVERMAYSIIIGQLDGGVFNWDAARWDERK